MIHTRVLPLLIAALLFSGKSNWVYAQEAEANPATSTLTSSAVEELQIQTDVSSLDDDGKKRVGELFASALEQAKRTENFEKQVAAFQGAKDSVAPRLEELKRKAEEIPAVVTVVGNAELTELEQQLSDADRDLKDFKERLTNVDSKIASRSARKKSIRDRLVEAKKERDEFTKQAEATAGDSAALVAAKKADRQTRLAALEAEVPALEAELLAIDAEDAVDLLRVERDYLVRMVDVAEKSQQRIQDAVNTRRTAEANRQIAEARSEAEKETNPVLRLLAERNVALAEQYQTLSQSITAAEKKLKATRAIRDHWKQEASSAKKKEESIGLTDTIGTMLRKQKLSLPSARTYLASISERSSTVNEAQLELLEREEERSSDLDKTIIDLSLGGETVLPSALRPDAEALLAKRNEVLAPLIRAQSNYFDTLVEISNAEQQIANQIADYSNFIDERVLWVRSGKPIWSNFGFDRSDLWLLERGSWLETWRTILADASKHVGWYVFAAVLFCLLVRNRMLFRRRLKHVGEQAKSGSCTQFVPTIVAVLITVLAALQWPSLIGFCSWRFSTVAGANPVLKALAQGLYSVAVVYFPLEVCRLMCKPDGLCEAHFEWPTKAVQLMRVAVRRIMLVGLPLVLLTAMLRASTTGLGRDTLERLTFVATTLAMSLFLARVFNAHTGIFGDYLRLNSTGWASRLQPMWYWLVVLSPLVLTGLTIFGYYYTAQQLAWRLYWTGCLVAAVIVVSALGSRLLLVQRRKLSIEQAKQRRAAQLKASSDETAAATAEELPSAEDLREQIGQSRSLLRTVMAGIALLGIWAAWVDVMPALSFLEQWPVWESSQQVTIASTNDAGEVSFVTRDVLDPVTIADVIVALLIAVLTLVSARNIPGVLEISVLQRLPIEASVRYAITTIVSYLIVVAGLIFSCKWLGIHWQQVQWMATALTFGLAFGLQEMFANFVAGIIILFERPIRVGDIVTVDDVTGVVSKVRIRATTITNWDRKDYVVPNKDFITGRVLNWTLSDQFNRIVVNVGVAYGSDKEKTLAAIRRVAIEHPVVVDEPEPIVTFEEFGASSLNFVLRCYIAMKDMPHRLNTVHELHTRIDDAFRQEKIEIAFPQQDIHLRSVPADKESGLLLTNGTKKKKTRKFSSDDAGE